MAVMDRDEKSGCDSSCLHSDVPRTPHPTMARSEVMGWGVEKARAGESTRRAVRRESTAMVT